MLTVAGLQNGVSELLRIDGETIALTNGNSATTAANSYDLSVSVTAGTATVSISKVGGYSTAARPDRYSNALAYENTSQDPLGVNRTVTLTVDPRIPVARPTVVWIPRRCQLAQHGHDGSGQ